MVETLIYYLQFPYVRYALIAAILIALCSSLLGVTLVMKRMSFIGDGLSHVAFGALAVSSSVKVMLERASDAGVELPPDSLIVLPITLLCAVLLLRLGQSSKIKGDAVIAMISVGSLALGYTLMNVFPSSSNIAGDVCSALFGSTSIMTLIKEDVLTCVILSAAVVSVFLLFYNRIFAITFDENFARATGINCTLYNLIIALVIGAVIVLGMELIGSLLISALVVFPALSSMRVFKSFKNVIISSAVVSVSCALLGVLLSILINTPVGSTVVVLNIICFGVFSLAGALRVKFSR